MSDIARVTLTFTYDTDTYTGDEDDSIERVVAIIKEEFGDSLTAIEQEIAGLRSAWDVLYEKDEPDEEDEEDEE